jgi:hypothetical protein
MRLKFVGGMVDEDLMALLRQTMPEDDDPIHLLNGYSRLIGYEYALRREAGLEPKDAIRWTLRRVLPPPDGLHPAIALIAGYEVERGVWEDQASSLMRTLIVSCDKSWLALRKVEGWQPGTIGMGW